MNARVAILSIACLAIIIAAPWLGALPDGEAAAWTLENLRIPRVLMAVLVGGTFALVGTCYQTIFGNFLAAPDTVGTTAGATLGALVAVVLVPWATGGLPLTAIMAFAGALAVSLMVASIAASGRARANDILLAGIAISLAAGALSSGVQYTADQLQMYAAIRWTLGHLPQVGYQGVAMIAPFVACCWLLLLMQVRGLQSLQGGEERAYSQGVNVPWLRSIVLGVGALGVGACVAWCGPIAFLGLIVPHIVRLLLGQKMRVLLPMSIVVGAAFLTTCDTVSRLVWPGRELPVGIITSAIGAPLIVWLVSRQRR